MCIRDRARGTDGYRRFHHIKESKEIFHQTVEMCIRDRANAGGVSVSGLEMTQNSIKLGWSQEEVDEKLKSIMKNIHEACVQSVSYTHLL